MDQARSILVVDDEKDVVSALKSSLGDRGYEIRQAARWTDAIEEIQDRRPDAVLLDLYLPRVQGEALLEFIHDHDPLLPVVIVSSDIDSAKLEELGRRGASGFVRKPFSEEDLFVVVEQTLSEVESKRAGSPEKPGRDEDGQKDEEAGGERVDVSDRGERRPDPEATPASGEDPAAKPPPVTGSRASGRRPPPARDRHQDVHPGAGVERLEQARPEVRTEPARRRHRTPSRRQTRLRYYILAFFLCLVATWLIFFAQDMLSGGFFGIGIN